jgi:hypothetical protein
VAGGPVAGIDELRRHRPLRPTWLCRACAAQWPCQPAKLVLLHDFADDRIGLSVYGCSMLHEAINDLLRLDAVPDPAILFDRFVAWTRVRP